MFDIPVKYTIGSQSFFGLPEDSSVRVRRDGGRTISDFTGTAGGLTVTAELVEYSDFDAREWVVFFRNDTERDSELLSDVLAVSADFKGGDARLYTCNGDFCSCDGYETEVHELAEGGDFSLEQAPSGGRPCDRAFPYQRLLFGSKGVNIAIGWPGQWFCRWTRSGGDIHLDAGQQSVRTVLRPGESFRTPRIATVEFDGGLDNGINVWRRWYRRYVLPQNAVPLVHGLDNNGGLEFCSADAEQQLGKLREYVEGGVDINMWWIDAGWYPSTLPDGKDDWWKTTGTWNCDSKRFPDGFKPIGEYCKEHGIKLLVWFEVERANRGTRLYDEHPEWMLKNTDEPMEYGLMLDMGNPECVGCLSRDIADFLIENNVSVYRQDYNFEPLDFWRYNEAPDRLGMCENQYICGYLGYWDYLLEHVPGLLIDSCASGGRRNDLETMRRAVVLHQTDEAYGNHPVKHAFFQTLYGWIPYFRGFMDSWEAEDGSYRKPDYYHQPKPDIGNYNLLSALAPAMSLGGYGYTVDYSGASPDALEVKRAIAVWREVSPYLLGGDFYALTPYHKSRELWTCWQFDCPERGEGVFEVIRNNAAPDDELTVQIPVEGELLLENLVTGETMTARGAITFRQPVRSVMVWKYRRADG